MKYFILLLSVIATPVLAQNQLDQSEYETRKKQAYEWYESLSKSEQRGVQDNLAEYKKIMDQFNALMIDMNESERIYIIEENNNSNSRTQN